ncbi:MAG: TolC family protein [Myxococcota bacterium]
MHSPVRFLRWSLPPQPLALLSLCSVLSAAPHVQAALPMSQAGAASALPTPETVTPSALEWQEIPALLEKQPALRALRLQQQAAQLDARAAQRLPDPSVGVSVYEAHVNLSSIPLMLEAAQAIPLHGRLKLEADMAQLAPEMQAQAQERLRRLLLAEARRAFALARETQQSTLVMKETRERLQQLRLTTQQRLETGSSMLMDLLKLDEAIARLQHEQLDMQQELQMARAQLASLLNLPVEQLPELGKLPPLPRLSWERLEPHLLQQQPMLEELKLAQQEAKLQEALTRTNYAPELMVRGAYMLELGGMNMWSLGAMVQVPLQARGRQLPQQEAARLRSESITHQQEAERLNLLREGRMNLIRLEQAHRHLQLHDEQLMPLAQKMVETTLAAYQNGTGKLDEVLNTLTMRRMHHQERERFLREGHQALAMLEAMTGPLEGDLP